MAGAIGIIISIELAIIALIVVLAYFHFGKFVESNCVAMKRISDRWDNIGEKFTSTLTKFDEALDELKISATDLRGKMEIIERDLSPLARTIDKTLNDANPLVKSLSDSSGNFTSASKNVKFVTDDVKTMTGNIVDVTNGLRETIIPTLDSARSLLQGVNEALRMFKSGGDKNRE